MSAAPVERRVSNRDGRQIHVSDWGDPLDPRTPILGLPGYARNAPPEACPHPKAPGPWIFPAQKLA